MGQAAGGHRAFRVYLREDVGERRRSHHIDGAGEPRFGEWLRRSRKIVAVDDLGGAKILQEDFFLRPARRCGHAVAELRKDGDGNEVKVASLGPGATFGEEALIKGEPRNATVRMTTAGRVLRLGKEDFDRLLRSQLVHEISADQARRDVDFRGAVFIDCRFEEEWELWRLKNARHVPLDEIRERSRGLDPKREYIVYCRTGRRSRAAAFLMRQVGLNAVALKGGIAEWPYERETDDVNV